MRFVSPHRSILDNSVSGSVDLHYDEDWLTSNSAGYPVKTTGNMSLTVTTTTNMDMIAVCHHSIVAAATITAGGFGTIATTSARGDGIPYNYGKVVTSPVASGSLAFSVTGNTGPIVVGMLYAGLSYQFNDFLSGRRFTPQAPFPWEGEFSSLAPYDMGLSAQRRVSGTVIIETDASYEQLVLTHEAQRMGNLPVLWLDSDIVNDPWLCQFSFEEEHREKKHFITLQIVEIPRLRWPS